MIRKGREQDLPQVAAIYDHILTEEEAGRSTVGWVRGVYPTEATAREAMDKGELFVLEEDGGIIAAACCIRWWWTRPRRGRGQGVHSWRSMRSMPGHMAVHICGWIRM